jgi:hypothetical protein
MLPASTRDRPQPQTGRLARALLAAGGVLVGLVLAVGLPQASSQPIAPVVGEGRPAAARVVRRDAPGAECGDRREAARTRLGSRSHSPSPCR